MYVMKGIKLCGGLNNPGLNWITKSIVDMDFIHLDLEKDESRALFNTVMDLQIPNKRV
jgi:hypothetical protein